MDDSTDERIYLSFVRSFFRLSEKDALSIITILVRLKILESRYKLMLNDRMLPEEYNYLKEVPSQIFDDETYENVQISFEKNVYLFFRVVKDE